MGADPCSPVTNADDSVLCLAVVRESGREVTVFDVSGRAVTFSESSLCGNAAGPNARAAGGGSSRELCFSTHGLGSGDCDGLLTPCFDADGLHGEPEEGCFCGIDTPHLHAHVRNMERCCGDGRAKELTDGGCGGGGGRRGCSGGKGKGFGSTTEADLGFLASLTLHPVPDESCATVAPNAPGEEAALLKMPVNASMPNQCNSEEYKKQLSQHGMEKMGRRMHKVKHDDHYDFLVHNESTSTLHLEHPCDSCGDNDLHGNFRLVHKRVWRDADDERDFHLHFFEAAKQPFCLLDVLANMFDVDSDRARVVRCDDILCEGCEGCDVGERKKNSGDGCGDGGSPLREVASFTKKHSPHPSCPQQQQQKPCCTAKTCASASLDQFVPLTGATENVGVVEPPPLAAVTISMTTVRSTFFVAKICCASEIPAINAIVEPLPGVSKVLINTTTKTVYVDHDHTLTAAKEIEEAINLENFGAKLKNDGGAAVTVGGGIGVPRLGRSHFFVERICCASEIPAINSIVEPMEGVESVSINIANKIVYVDHDIDIVSAADIVGALNNERFGAHVKQDAGHTLALVARLPTDSFVESVLAVSNEKTENLEKEVLAVLDPNFPGQIRERSMDTLAKMLKVEHNPYLLTANRISQALRNEGFQVTIEIDGAADGTWALGLLDEGKEEEVDTHSSKVNPFVIASGVFWMISMLSLIGGYWEFLKYVGLVSVVLGLPPIALKAYRTLRRCQFDANCMMLFAALGAVGLQEFTEAAAVTFLFAISEALESRATARARKALSSIVSLRPDRANLVNPITNEIVVVPAGSVGVGAVVSVRTGDKIPCDGVVIEGHSTVDESSLTGESRPVGKGPRDLVSGGTINSGATQLVVKTTATVEKSAVARLIRLVEEAQANRSPTEKLVDTFAKRYTPVVVLAALSMCTIPWAWGKEVGKEWTMVGLITIVVACPCALIISTPVTYVAGLAATAQKGVIIKGGSHLEALGQVKKIAFDKTGTLTEGDFALLHLITVGGCRTRKEILEYLALMEAPSSHPLAAALVAAAKNEGVSIPKNVSVLNHTVLKGEGVTATVDGLTVHVGNDRMFRRLGLFGTLPEKERIMTEMWATAAGTVGFISIEGEGIVGAYSVADAVRPESMSVVQDLFKLGIEVNMLTGDGRDAALAIGNQVGLAQENIHSQLLPEDKLKLVSKMKEESSIQTSVFGCKRKRHSNVLMCGDGVNDAPALALADVGVAMGAGAALAMETSDVTLMDSNLTKLLYSIRMGKRVVRTIVQNVAFSLLAKAVVLAFTFAGKSSLWAAIASDVGAMLIVTLNGMKLLPSKEKINLMPSRHQEKRDVRISDASVAETKDENSPSAHERGFGSESCSQGSKSVHRGCFDMEATGCSVLKSKSSNCASQNSCNTKNACCVAVAIADSDSGMMKGSFHDVEGTGCCAPRSNRSNCASQKCCNTKNECCVAIAIAGADCDIAKGSAKAVFSEEKGCCKATGASANCCEKKNCSVSDDDVFSDEFFV